mgnify:CR=1 FL=1
MTDGTENDFHNNHFDEPNILAHARINDRTIDGKKALFIEEIQSDWHQKGRKGGYEESGRVQKLQEQVKNLIRQQDAIANDTSKDLEWHDLRKKEQALHDEINSIEKSVPDAPFKKTWHELMFKRLLDKAVKEGYDKIAWTTGEQQASRYKLSKQIKGINWSPVKNTTTTDKNIQLNEVTRALGGTKNIYMKLMKDQDQI